MQTFIYTWNLEITVYRVFWLQEVKWGNQFLSCHKSCGPAIIIFTFLEYVGLKYCIYIPVFMLCFSGVSNGLFASRLKKEMCDFTCDEDLLVYTQYHLYVRTTILLIHPMPSPLSCVWVRRQLSGVLSLFLPCGFWSSNSGHQAWWQVPFTHQTILLIPSLP